MALTSSKMSNEDFKCSICQLTEIDDLNFGEIYRKQDLSVHLFCLYFSTHLNQLGQNTAGIIGFQIRDIKKLIKDSIEVTCCYCKKRSATTCCNFQGCKNIFHQVCGFKQHARFEYLDQFHSYCHLHSQIDEIDSHQYPEEKSGCWICYEKLGPYHPVATIPSCCYKIWFHQQCLRKYAINAGYAFRCPLCRNSNYGDFARRHGIYVPEYEALWEKTHDYTDIERYHNRCNSPNCLCPGGEQFQDKKWIIRLCSNCGSYGLHNYCQLPSDRQKNIICDDCAIVEKNNYESNLSHPHASPLTILNHPISICPSNQLENAPQISSNPANLSQKIIDLTNDDNKSESDLTSNHSILKNDLTVENGMDVDIDIASLFDYKKEFKPYSFANETLAVKRLREKAERPLENKMREFRLNLLFRDLKKKKN